MTMTRPSRGYTLLELVVSIGVFSMIMLAVTAAYLTLISLDRQARAGNQLAASLTFAIDSMSRGIRAGHSYVCGGTVNCANGTSIQYIDGETGQYVTYILKSDGTIGQCTGSTTGCLENSAVSLTDPRITIEQLRFSVRGVGTTGANQTVQPQVTLVVQGSMEADGQTAEFSIQTGATQRLIEI